MSGAIHVAPIGPMWCWAAISEDYRGDPIVLRHGLTSLPEDRARFSAAMHFGNDLARVRSALREASCPVDGGSRFDAPEHLCGRRLGPAYLHFHQSGWTFSWNGASGILLWERGTDFDVALGQISAWVEGWNL